MSAGARTAEPARAPESLAAGAREPWLPVAALLVAAALLVFAPVIVAGGFFFDDTLWLTGNPHLRSATGLYELWFQPRTPDYYPLTSTSFWLEWRLWGEWAQGYHLTNVLLHAAASVLLWRVLRRLAVPGAALAALLFAIHPVNVESVAWITTRKNVLSMALACAGVLLHLRALDERRARLHAWALALFVLALLSKASVVMLPVALALVAWYREGRVGRRTALCLAPWFLAALALGLVAMHFQSSLAIGELAVRDDPMSARIATAGCAVWFYLGKALVPLGICFSYPMWDVMSHGAAAYVPLGLLLAGFAALWALRRRGARPLLVALAGYVAMLLPVLGLVDISFMRYSLVSDHWQYQAIPFVLAVLGAGASRLEARLDPERRRAALVALSALLLLLGASSFRIAALYRSAELVWEDTLERNPTSWLAHGQLGELHLFRAGDDPAAAARAIAHLERAAELRPDVLSTHANLGFAYLQTGQPERALESFERALAAPVATTSERALLHSNVASLHMSRRDYAAAEAQLDLALQLDAEQPRAWYNLGVTRAQRGRAQAARDALARSIELDERYLSPRLALAELEELAGNHAEALTHARAAAALAPDDAKVRALVERLSRRAP